MGKYSREKDYDEQRANRKTEEKARAKLNSEVVKLVERIEKKHPHITYFMKKVGPSSEASGTVLSMGQSYVEDNFTEDSRGYLDEGESQIVLYAELGTVGLMGKRVKVCLYVMKNAEGKKEWHLDGVTFNVPVRRFLQYLEIIEKRGEVAPTQMQIRTLFSKKY